MSHHNLVAREEDQYQGLRFSFADMEMEIENMRRLAKQFLERGSYERIIPEWKDQLSAFRSQGSGALTIWRIQEETPIQTRESIGEYESGGRKGKHNIFGRISGSWEIRLPTVTGKKRRQIPATFILLGLASTKISIWANQDEGDPLELARWSIDIGDASSPGCHFHTQIDLDDDNHKFPKSLPVPRFPTLLHTPMDALDFLLAEIFQDRWLQHTSSETNVSKVWASCQRRRLEKILDWQRQKLGETSGPPWIWLKRQKPMIDLFVSDKKR